MNDDSPVPPARVPTLTEVVAWPHGAMPTTGAGEADPMFTPALRGADEQMLRAVLVEVQRQVDLMLDYRLREMLTPILNRASDSILREARVELASTLRDVVSRAVAQELARHRTR